MPRPKITSFGSRILRWTLGGLPELEFFSVDEQAQVIRELQTSGLSWQSVFYAIVLLCIVLSLREFIWSHISIPRFVDWWLSPIFPAFVIIASSTIWQRRRAAMFFRRKLLIRGVPVCIKCGYCLRGSVSDKCPECGREIEAGIRRMIEVDAERGGKTE